MRAPFLFPRTVPAAALARARSWGRGGRRVLAWIVIAALLATTATLALLEQAGGPSQTAFARAPGGQYAVVAKNTGAATVVTVVGTGVNAEPMEIATVPHLRGYSLRGTVSPSGRQVAILAPDHGPSAHALASLLALDLETGLATRLAEGLEPLQDALWTPDSNAVVVTRGGRTATGELHVAVVRVGLDGRETVLERHAGALMVAPLGFDAEGRLLAVRLDAGGSTLTRAGEPLRWLSSHVTRDWALSPDGTRIAFIEASTWQGLRYVPRVVGIEGSGGVAAASTSTTQALGAAWPPAGDGPSFGREPSIPPGSVSAQAPSGFDVPLGYSGDGNALVVRRWSGAGFDAPGTPSLQIVTPEQRRLLDGFTRFFGWSAR